MPGNLSCIILAGGNGHQSEGLPPILQSLRGKTVLEYVLDIAEGLDIRPIAVVTNDRSGPVGSCAGRRATVLEQKEGRGSGYALLGAREFLKDPDGAVLVINGDRALLRAATILSLLTEFQQSEVPCAFLTAILERPSSCSRVIRDPNGRVISLIVKPCKGGVTIREIAAGAFCFRNIALIKAIDALQPQNSAEEFFVTHLVADFADQGQAAALLTPDSAESVGIHSLDDLAWAESIIDKRALDQKPEPMRRKHEEESAGKSDVPALIPIDAMV